jgi:hypothetical protein
MKKNYVKVITDRLQYLTCGKLYEAKDWDDDWVMVTDDNGRDFWVMDQEYEFA